MDLAQLTLGVNSAPLKEGQSQLQKFAKEALEAAKDTDKLNDTLTEGATASGKLSSSIDRMLGPLASFKGLIGGIFAGFSLSVLGNMADTWSDVSSRVGLAIGNMDGASEAMQRLTTTARLTYSSLSQTAEGFVRNSLVLDELGKSTQEQLNYTEALNLALVASGAKGQQALLVQESLSRSMSMGVMRGQEWNNIVNYSGEVAKALADELGTTVNGMRGLVAQGKVTGEVIYNAMTKRLEEFTAKAEEMPATLGDGFLLIGNAITALVGSFDQLSGVTQYVAGLMVSFSDGVLWVAQNIDKFSVSADTLEKILWTLAPAMIAAFGPSVLAMVGSLIGGVGTGLVGAFVALRTVMLAHPLVFWGTVIATLISAFHNWVEAFPAVTKAFDWLYEKAMFVLDSIKVAFTALFGSTFFEDGEVNVNIKGDDAAGKINNAMKGGGADAAGKMQDGIIRGAQEGARSFQDSAQAAVAQYEALNGKLAEVIVRSHQTGAEYVYNAYTGAVKEATPPATEQMKDGVIQGGQSAASAMGSAISSAGSEVAQLINMAALNIAQEADMARRLFEAQIGQINAATAKLWAESAKANQEAMAIGQETFGTGSKNRSTSSGGGGGSSGGTTWSGGGFPSFNPWNDPFARQNQTPANPGPTVTQGVSPVNVQNVLDPNMTIDALDTASGHNAIVNVIKYNREELRAILGSV